MAVNAARQANGFLGTLTKWSYKLSALNIYGLHHDDCLDENADVTEALRRLPQHLVDERNFRITRALQLSMTKTYLPKEQWTKWEEDNKYLQPYLQEVIKERQEREEWNKQ